LYCAVCPALIVTEVGFVPFGCRLKGLLPVPASDAICGESAASSWIATLAVRLPAAFGVKTTLMLQLAPTATLEHELVSAKSPAFAPPTEMPLTWSVPVPAFVI